jgi:hypothetical protein
MAQNRHLHLKMATLAQVWAPLPPPNSFTCTGVAYLAYGWLCQDFHPSAWGLKAGDKRRWQDHSLNVRSLADSPR